MTALNGLHDDQGIDSLNGWIGCEMLVGGEKNHRMANFAFQEHRTPIKCLTLMKQRLGATYEFV
jgi:hypothetical protein